MMNKEKKDILNEAVNTTLEGMGFSEDQEKKKIIP